MRGVARLGVACLLAGLAFLVVPMPGASAQPRAAVVRLAAGAPATTTTKAPATKAPSAPKVDLEQDQANADAQQTKRKIVVGAITVVLLVIVVYGHRVRTKRRKKAAGGG